MAFFGLFKSAREKEAEFGRIRDRITQLKRQKETGRPSTTAVADAMLTNDDIDREIARLTARLPSQGPA